MFTHQYHLWMTKAALANIVTIGCMWLFNFIDMNFCMLINVNKNEKHIGSILYLDVFMKACPLAKHQYLAILLCCVLFLKLEWES